MSLGSQVPSSPPLTSFGQVLKNEQKPAVELCAEQELSSYSRFTRSRHVAYCPKPARPHC